MLLVVAWIYLKWLYGSNFLKRRAYFVNKPQYLPYRLANPAPVLPDRLLGRCIVIRKANKIPRVTGITRECIEYEFALTKLPVVCAERGNGQTVVVV